MTDYDNTQQQQPPIPTNIYNKRIKKKSKKMIHTFSPNWYRPQCLYFHQTFLYYASNYVLYKYNLNSRRIQCDRCFRKIAIRTGMNTKDIKIHTINILNGKLIVGTNQQQAVILSVDDLQFQAIVDVVGSEEEKRAKEELSKDGAKDQSSTGVISCTIIGNKPHQSAIFITQSYKLTHLSYKTPSLSILPYPYQERPKQILSLSTTNILLSTKGKITVYNKQFTQIIHQIQSSQIGLDNQFVLSADWIIHGNVVSVAMFTRSKNGGNWLYMWDVVENVRVKEGRGQAEKVEEGEGEGRMDIEGEQERVDIGFKKIGRVQIKVIYPKIMSQKIKNVQKAAMTLKLLDKKHILLSGKLGQLFIINIVNSPECLTIKPQSLQQIPQCLQIIQDPKHYKQIYHIATHTRPCSPLHPSTTQLYTISIDQTMCIWQLCQSASHPFLKFKYSTKFLTSELNSIFFSESDPKTIFLLLRDSNIRSMSPFGENSAYLAQYWKFTKKWKIVKAVGHPTEVGIVAMVTHCGKVLVYDLYEDRLIKLYDFEINHPNDEIINISFEQNSILQSLQQLSVAIATEQDLTWSQTTLKSTRYHSKQIDSSQKIGLLVQQKSFLTFILQRPVAQPSSEIHMQAEEGSDKMTEKQKQKQKEKIVKLKRVCRVQRVHNTKLWDGNSMLMSQGKANKLWVWIWFAGQVRKVEISLKIGGRSIFKVTTGKGQLMITIIQYKGKKVVLHWFQVNAQEVTPVQTAQTQLSQVCQQAVLDPNYPQALFYNPKQNQLTHIKFPSLPQINSSILETGSKIQNLSFYFSDHIVAGFKDQSVKVLKLADIQHVNLRDQPQKRVKRDKQDWNGKEDKYDKMGEGEKMVKFERFGKQKRGKMEQEIIDGRNGMMSLEE